MPADFIARKSMQTKDETHFRGEKKAIGEIISKTSFEIWSNVDHTDRDDRGDAQDFRCKEEAPGQIEIIFECPIQDGDGPAHDEAIHDEEDGEGIYRHLYAPGVIRNG